MFEFLIERSRRIRHVLDAWCLLLVCLLFGFIPLIGLPLGLGFVLLGIFAALRLTRYGMVFQGLLLVCLFGFMGGLLVLGNFAILQNQLERIRGRDAPVYVPSNPAVFNPPYISRKPSIPISAPPITVPPPALAQVREPQPVGDAVASANPPTPAPPPKNRKLYDEARSLAMAWHNGRNAHQLSEIIDQCDETVEINGKPLPRKELIERIPDVDETYLNDQEQIADALYIYPMKGDQWRVTFVLSFVRSVGTDEPRIHGLRSRTILLRDNGKEFRIIADFYKTYPILDDPNVVVAGIQGSTIQTLLATCVESDIAGDFEAGMACYAPQVKYFNESRSKQEIKLDKEQYAIRWPRRSENFDTPLQLEVLPDKRVLARFYGRFRTESPERGDWNSGIVEHRFVVTLIDNKLLIVEQSGKVTESQKGKLESK